MMAGIVIMDSLPQQRFTAWAVGGLCVICTLLLIVGNRKKLPYSGVVVGLLAASIGAFHLHGTQERQLWTAGDTLSYYRATVLSVGRTVSGYPTAEVNIESQLTKDSTTGSWYETSIQRRVLLTQAKDSTFCPFSLGEEIGLHISIRPTRVHREWVGRDYSTSLARRGIAGTAFAGVKQVIYRKEWADEGLKISALRMREKIGEYIDSWGLTKTTAGTIKALTIGDKRDLEESVRTAFGMAGVSHLLALSGLHVGLLAWAVNGLLRPLERKRWGKGVAFFIGLTTLWAYAFITGLSPSVVRAVGMYSIYCVGRWAYDDTVSLFDVLTLTAFLMLLYRPTYLFDIGFQLSFVAVFGIVVAPSLPFSQRLQRHPVLKWATDVLYISLVAQTATLPLILYHFGTFPVYFLLSNLLVAPFIPLVMVLFLISLCFASVEGIGTVSVFLLEHCVQLMTSAINALTRLPFAQLSSLYINAWQAFGLYVCAFLAYLFWREKTARRLCYAILGACGWTAYSLFATSGAEADSLHVQQGEVFFCTQGRVVWTRSQQGIYTHKGRYVALVRSNDWRNRRAKGALPLEALYLCRGYQGSVADLLENFRPRLFIIDSQVSNAQKEQWTTEIAPLSIPYRTLKEGEMLSVSLSSPLI